LTYIEVRDLLGVVTAGRGYTHLDEFITNENAEGDNAELGKEKDKVPNGINRS